MNHISDNIKRMRERSGLSQQQLADRSGISKAQISRLESGKQDNPQIKTLIPLSSALGVSLEEIAYGEQSGSFSYITKMIEVLPEQDRESIRKLLKIWVLTSQSDQMGK